METLKLALERETVQLTAARAQLQAAQQDLRSTGQHIKQRLALARWQFAGRAVSLPSSTGLLPSVPAHRMGHAPSGLAKKAQALERLTAAKTAALQRLCLVRAEQALKRGVAHLRKDNTAGDAFSAAVRVRQAAFYCSCPYCVVSMPVIMYQRAIHCVVNMPVIM